MLSQFQRFSSVRHGNASTSCNREVLVTNIDQQSLVNVGVRLLFDNQSESPMLSLCRIVRK